MYYSGPATRDITNEQAAYLAGLIDGEGCVGARISTEGYIRSALEVVNTNYAVLLWAQAVTGVGAVYPKKRLVKGKQAWKWVVSLQPASELLRRLRPYLRIKRMESHLFCILAALSRVPKNLKLPYAVNQDLANKICLLKH